MRVITRKKASMEHYIDEGYEKYLDFLEAGHKALQSLIGQPVLKNSSAYIQSIRIEPDTFNGEAATYQRAPSIYVRLSTDVFSYLASDYMASIIRLLKDTLDKVTVDCKYDYFTTWTMHLACSSRSIVRTFSTGVIQRYRETELLNYTLHNHLMHLDSDNLFSENSQADTINLSDIGNPVAYEYDLWLPSHTQVDFENILIKLKYNQTYSSQLVQQVKQVIHQFFSDFLSEKGLFGDLVINIKFRFSDRTVISRITTI